MEVVWSGAWLEIEGRSAIYSRSEGGTCRRRSSLDTWRTAMRSSKARGQTLSVNAGACPRSRTSTGGGWRRGQVHARTVVFWTRRACACCGGSGVGERQGAVKGDGSRLVARCGSRRRALERARAKQRARRQPERVETLPSAMSSCGHQAGMVKTTSRSGQTLALNRAVLCLGEVMAHTQTDQIGLN